MTFKARATSLAVLAALLLFVGPASAQNNDEVTAFRITKLELRSPKVIAPIPIVIYDITNDVNSFIQKQFNEDSSKDSWVDANFLAIFDPLNQKAGYAGLVEIAQAKCTMASSGKDCYLDAKGTAATVYYKNSSSGTCAPRNYITNRKLPAPATHPCFLTEAATIGVDLAGIRITLENAFVSAKWIGKPATRISGMIRGFISLTDAQATGLPSWVPTIGQRKLSELLATNAAGLDKNGTTEGYWIYLTFDAVPVKLTE